MYWLRASKLRSGKTPKMPVIACRNRVLADVDVTRGVVFEHRVFGVHRDDRFYVVLVPRRVVAVDEVLERRALHGTSLR